jgi:Fe-S-cluster containining protein
MKKRKKPNEPVPNEPVIDALDEAMDAMGFERAAFIRDEQQAAKEALARGTSQQALADLASRAADVATEVLAHHLTVLPPDPPIACGDGCAFCCQLRAEVTVAEVARLALHLRATRSPEALETLRRKIEETARRVGHLAPNERAEARVSCALLEDARCTVYEARPLTCRACNSASADDCERALADVEVQTVVYAPQRALYRYEVMAMARALAASGLDGTTHELHTALAAALAKQPENEAK